MNEMGVFLDFTYVSFFGWLFVNVKDVSSKYETVKHSETCVLIHGWQNEQKVLEGDGCTDGKHYFFYCLIFIEN